MTDPLIVLAAESLIRDGSRRLTEPHGAECLFCFVARMLEEHGCNNELRWALRCRDLRAPRATALEDRLFRMGGFCDCEIFLNGMMLADRPRLPSVQVPSAYAPLVLRGGTYEEMYDASLDEPVDPDQQEIDELEAIADLEMDDPFRLDLRPTCAAVRLGSTQPCRHWVRQPRRW